MKGILTSIKAKNRFHRKFSRGKDEAIKTDLNNKFKDYRNHLNKITKLTKANDYRNFFEENKKNMLKTWNGIKQVINIDKKPTQKINCIIGGNLYIHDPKKMTEMFNNHFSQVGPKLEKRIGPTNERYEDYLNERVENSLIIESTNDDEVLSVIKQFKNGKATGPNSLNTIVLKKCAKELSEPLALLFTMSFSNGIFPESLKRANVIPIHKKEDKTCVNNYRPISLISNIGKIMEKLIYPRLYLFLEHNIICHNQFGFRYNHSTEHALVALTQEIQDAFDKDA